jgi:anti-sigma regulatory factor (Ser/Thr protein kinase)
MAQRTVAADPAQLTVLNEFLRDFWRAGALAPAAMQCFQLALEEIFLNIVMHGVRPESMPLIQVSLNRVAESVTMTVEDDGPQFDPLSLPAPDLSAGLADRPVGGLGVFLVRELMDIVSYERVGARNQLRMVKTLASWAAGHR